MRVCVGVVVVAVRGFACMCVGACVRAYVRVCECACVDACTCACV